MQNTKCKVSAYNYIAIEVIMEEYKDKLDEGCTQHTL